MLYSLVSILLYAYDASVKISGDTVSVSVAGRELATGPNDVLFTVAAAYYHQLAAHYHIDTPQSFFSVVSLGSRVGPNVLDIAFDQTLFESLVVPVYSKHNGSSLIDNYISLAAILKKENNTINLMNMLSAAHDVFVDLRINPKEIESDSYAPFCALDEVLDGRRCSVKGPLKPAAIAGLKVVFPTGEVTQTSDFMVKDLVNFFLPISSSTFDAKIPFPDVRSNALIKPRGREHRHRVRRSSEETCVLNQVIPDSVYQELGVPLDKTAIESWAHYGDEGVKCLSVGKICSLVSKGNINNPVATLQLIASVNGKQPCKLRATAGASVYTFLTKYIDCDKKEISDAPLDLTGIDTEREDVTLQMTLNDGSQCGSIAGMAICGKRLWG